MDLLDTMLLWWCCRKTGGAGYNCGSKGIIQAETMSCLVKWKQADELLALINVKTMVEMFKAQSVHPKEVTEKYLLTANNVIRSWGYCLFCTLLFLKISQ